MVPSQLWHKILTWVFKFLAQNSYLSTFPTLVLSKFQNRTRLSPQTIEKSEKSSIFNFFSLFLSFWQEFLRSVDPIWFSTRKCICSAATLVSMKEISNSCQISIEKGVHTVRDLMVKTWKFYSVSLWSWSLSFKREKTVVQCLPVVFSSISSSTLQIGSWLVVEKLENWSKPVRVPLMRSHH